MRRVFGDDLRIGSKGLGWNWRRRRHDASNSGDLRGRVPTGEARNPRSSPFWDLRTTAERLRRDTSRSNAEPAVRSWGKAWRSSRSEEHTSELQSRLHLVC